jgi:RNA polymerase sigma-70 factor (ECF subfamily)
VEALASIDQRSGIAQALRVAVPTSRTSDPDTARVLAARAGDRSAFGQLYERYVRMVHGVVLARVPPRDVDDIVHDVFLAAFERLASLREPAAFGAWLAAIARHRAVDYHRTSPPIAEVKDTAGPENPHREDALAVLAAICALPEAYRETLTLRLVEGMTGPEIAERTGLTHGSVRVNLHRGMLQLRAALTSMRSTP